MNYLLMQLLARGGYMDKADDGTGGGGGGTGTGTGETDAAAAEAAAAAKAAEDAGKTTKTGPTDEEARLIKEVMDKKAGIKRREEEIADLKSKLAQFEGIDVGGVKKMLLEKQAEETRLLEEKGQWDSLKKQMAEEHSKEKLSMTEKLELANSEASKLKLEISELTVGNAFAVSDFIKGDTTMPVRKARVLFGAHFEFKNGAVVAFDKPVGSADRNELVDGQGEPLSFEAAIKKIVEADPDHEQLLKSKVKQGAGSKTTQKAATPAQKMDAPTGVSRISDALAKGFGSKK